MQKYIDNVPPYVGDIAAFLFMTKSSKPYQISRHIVQLTDLLGRYVMMEHSQHVLGHSFKKSLHNALEAFVLFDESMIAPLELLDSLGVTTFLSYWLRNQRAVKKLGFSASIAMSSFGRARNIEPQVPTGLSNWQYAIEFKNRSSMSDRW